MNEVLNSLTSDKNVEIEESLQKKSQKSFQAG
jgi:hypothetical protein